MLPGGVTGTGWRGKASISTSTTKMELGVEGLQGHSTTGWCFLCSVFKAGGSGYLELLAVSDQSQILYSISLWLPKNWGAIPTLRGSSLCVNNLLQHGHVGERQSGMAKQEGASMPTRTSGNAYQVVWCVDVSFALLLTVNPVFSGWG